MLQESLAQLVVSLLAAVQLYTGLPQPPAPPAINLVPQSEIAANVCHQPCAGARAFYHPERGIFLDETMDVINDGFARSILLHELVHHAQEHAARDADVELCQRRWLREAEAYAAQNAYLAQQRVNTRVRHVPRVYCP